MKLLSNSNPSIKETYCVYCGSNSLIPDIPPKDITQDCTHKCTNCGMWSKITKE